MIKNKYKKINSIISFILVLIIVFTMIFNVSVKKVQAATIVVGGLTIAVSTILEVVALSSASATAGYTIQNYDDIQAKMYELGGSAYDVLHPTSAELGDTMDITTEEYSDMYEKMLGLASGTIPYSMSLNSTFPTSYINQSASLMGMLEQYGQAMSGILTNTSYKTDSSGKAKIDQYLNANPSTIFIKTVYGSYVRYDMFNGNEFTLKDYSTTDLSTYSLVMNDTTSKLSLNEYSGKIYSINHSIYAVTNGNINSTFLQIKNPVVNGNVITFTSSGGVNYKLYLSMSSGNAVSITDNTTNHVISNRQLDEYVGYDRTLATDKFTVIQGGGGSGGNSPLKINFVPPVIITALYYLLEQAVGGFNDNPTQENYDKIIEIQEQIDEVRTEYPTEVEQFVRSTPNYETSPLTLPSTVVEPQGMPSTHTVAQVNANPTVNPSPQPVNEPIPSSLVPDGLDPSKDYRTPKFTDKFPFCIPFDLINCIKVFGATPQVPSFTVPINIPTIGFHYDIVVSLEDFETVAVVFRSLILIAFIMSLVLVTRSLIRG